MGTYGTYTGVIRWYDKVNKVGHLLVLKDGEPQTDITGDYWASGATGYNTGEGFWLDKSPTTLDAGEPIGLLLSLTYATSSTSLGKTRVFVGNASGNKITWDGTDLVIVGTITATAGAVGGWTIGTTALYLDGGSAATSAGMSPGDFPFYAGATYANRSSGKFRVTPAGDMHAESGDLAAWLFTSTAMYKDGATAATSSGMSPSDYPYYSGAKYADRATAPYRVSTAGALYASNATITGTINWGSGKGVLNDTGLDWQVDANNYVLIDASSATGYIRTKSSNTNTPILSLKSTGTGTGGAIVVDASQTNTAAVTIMHTGTGGGEYGLSITASKGFGISSAIGDGFAAAFTSVSGGKPLYLEQDVSTLELVQFVGYSSGTTPLTRTIVKEADVTTATRAGWLRVYVTDQGNRITDQAYYLPLYTLA